MFGYFCGGPDGCRCNPCMCNIEAAHIREGFRLLWEQHVYWTRLIILGIAYDLPNLQMTTKRLLRNATDFAMFFRCFYGDEIALEFGRLVREHLVLAADLVKAAKVGNPRLVADVERRWYANADEIVCFLKHINPYWSIKRTRAMWYEHLALTKEEAVAELSKDYDKSIERFNQIENQALMMADDLANGVICQFGL